VALPSAACQTRQWSTGTNHPPVEMVPSLAAFEPRCPRRPCPRRAYASVRSGHPGTTTVSACAFRAVGSARTGRVEGASQARAILGDAHPRPVDRPMALPGHEGPECQRHPQSTEPDHSRRVPCRTQPKKRRTAPLPAAPAALVALGPSGQLPGARRNVLPPALTVLKPPSVEAVSGIRPDCGARPSLKLCGDR
jgi:hypothetical protein